MKAREIKTKEIKEFKPITVEITFESEDEFLSLWHRLNISDREVREFCDKGDMWGRIYRSVSSLLGMPFGQQMEHIRVREGINPFK